MEGLSVFKLITEILFNISTVLAFVIGAIWALYKFKEFRESKDLVELDVDANIFKLDTAIDTSSFTWDKNGNRCPINGQQHTHALEISLIFNNKGKTRIRLYNIQIGLNTMRLSTKTKFDKDTGHLRLKRFFTSGNIVPEMRVEDKPIEKTSFYYVEPGVTQTITYLTLITQPNELLQIVGKFSLVQKRIFPKRTRMLRGLYPHTVSKTYQIDTACA